jgi:hypothetical protein
MYRPERIRAVYESVEVIELEEMFSSGSTVLDRQGTQETNRQKLRSECCATGGVSQQRSARSRRA